MNLPPPTRIAAVMQPYFLPYIGYFHLMAVSDVFVIYDRIKYTKKGWINRNRYLLNGAPFTFSLPLRNAPDDSLICERELAPEYDPSRLLRRWEAAYRGAPYASEALAVLEKVLYVPNRNLFHFLLQGLEVLRIHLSLPSVLKVSSEIESQSVLRAQERVISLVKDVKAKTYVNPVGGLALYQPSAFAAEGLELRFLQPRLSPYPQKTSTFVPALSLLDLLMHLPREEVARRAREDWIWLPKQRSYPLRNSTASA
jgi:hypothetical protein